MEEINKEIERLEEELSHFMPTRKQFNKDNAVKYWTMCSPYITKIDMLKKIKEKINLKVV